MDRITFGMPCFLTEAVGVTLAVALSILSIPSISSIKVAHGVLAMFGQ